MSLPCARAGVVTHSTMSAAATRPRKAWRKANPQTRRIINHPLAKDERYISINIAICKGACVVLASRAASISRRLRLEDGQVFQHRDDADHDHDDARNVLRATVEGQHIDQIEDENDNQKRDQHTDQNVHTWLLARGETVKAPDFQGALRPLLNRPIGKKFHAVPVPKGL